MGDLDSKEKVEFQFFVAAFLDLLGQSAVLEKIRELPNPENKEEVAAFLELVKKSFGLVEMLNDAFNSNLKVLGEESDSAKKLPDEQRKLFRKFHSRPVKLQRFSDGVVVFASVVEREGDPVLAALSAVWGLLTGCGTTFLLFLSYGYPLRGGIDLGVGLEYKEGELFGPAVHNAYKLESGVAQYPRIVIGDELIGYLRSFESREVPVGASEAEKSILLTAKKVALRCLGLFVRDLDGRAILDYLGDGFRPSFEEVDFGGAGPKAFEFVKAQLLEAKTKKDFKLASRYLLLHQYFSSRIAKWPQSNPASAK